MAKDVIRPDENFGSGTGYNTPNHHRYLPYFKDCVGAIDGTHIKARLPDGKKIAYIGRKGYPTQNVLAVCDFNMCFTFVWAGWEGAAHDSRIFGEALRSQQLNFPHPPENKYYLVDSGYSHMTGYMSPYKGSDIRYHLPDFRRAVGYHGRPRTQKERFNYLHSSCRMIIERTFGVWKARFAILANMPFYRNINSQRDIVVATMTIHNYIRKKNIGDSAFLVAEKENYAPSTSLEGLSEQDREIAEDDDDNYWHVVRDVIANDISVGRR